MESPKTPKAITDLPEELLVRVFDHLKAAGKRGSSDLLNKTLVCKEWNRIIFENATLASKVKLKLTKYDMNMLAINSFQLSRNYRNIKVEDSENFRNFREQSSFDFVTPLSSQCHLTSLELFELKVSPQFMASLSVIRSIKSLTLHCCRADGDWSNPEPADFHHLRDLKIPLPTHQEILSAIKCKELDRLEANFYVGFETSFRLTDFLIQLDRCDELILEIQPSYVPSERAQLKLLWKKLSLTCYYFYDDYDCAPFIVNFLDPLCKASAENSETEIIFYRITSSSVWAPIFNYFKRITSLEIGLSISSLPPIETFNSLNNKMFDVKKLAIVTEFLTYESFFGLAGNLPNVTNLKLLDEIKDVELPPETVNMLQPFFNQITKLAVPNDFLEKAHSVNHISRVNFTNMKELSIEISKSSWWENSLFLELFCLRNQLLNHVNVDVKVKFQDSSNLSVFNLIRLYDLLRVAVSSCSIFIDIATATREFESGEFLGSTHWRSRAENEIEIFGKTLSEDENCFFI